MFLLGSKYLVAVSAISVVALLGNLSAADDVGTREDRAALFDYLLTKTMERESFSPVKNQNLGLDVRKGMLRFQGRAHRGRKRRGALLRPSEDQQCEKRPTSECRSR